MDNILKRGDPVRKKLEDNQMNLLSRSKWTNQISSPLVEHDGNGVKLFIGAIWKYLTCIKFSVVK